MAGAPTFWRRSRFAVLVIAGLGALAGCETVPSATEPEVIAVQPEEITPEVVVPTVAEVDEVEIEEEIVPVPEGPRPGEPVQRSGDEIMVAGQLFHTGTPVVLWTDPGGYDGYRVERRYAPWAEADWKTSQAAKPALSSPNRYGVRAAVLTPEQIEQVRGGGWELSLLQDVVDQFVLHYDASGTSRRCFERLHDDRGLSIHFMLDVDGTIYQTLDLKERAWHATVANSRSIGIEIANIGAYPDPAAKELSAWYAADEEGVRLTIPPEAQPESVRNAEAVLRPDREELIEGPVHGEAFYQYDLTPAQYAALVRLTATLCTVFPRIPCDYPRGADGELLTEAMEPDAWKQFTGILGHFHIQKNKIDPGPALQWKRLVNEARTLMGLPPIEPVVLETPSAETDTPSEVEPPLGSLPEGEAGE